MKINPPKGMRDISVGEMEYRAYILSNIINYYKDCGFFEISTPIIEDRENIIHSDGGDNLSLVFEILKRGEKLKSAIENNNNLSDLALRYDLTLPLSRFYCANEEQLIKPFKVIQTGSVFRAERPQKGRLREFRQVDIDIIGDESSDAEIELFSTSLNVLYNLGFRDLCLKLNDRRILNDIFQNFGLRSDSIPTVCVTCDKLDKIGIDGIRNELLLKNIEEKIVNKIIDFLKIQDIDLKDITRYCSDKNINKSLLEIISSLETIKPENFVIKFSPNLIRGQGYYTSRVAEVVSPAYSSSIAGGGRYDNLIQKFGRVHTPSVGFSIGFERIMEILLENGFGPKTNKTKIALLYSKDDVFINVLKKKYEFISKGNEVHLFKDVKNKKKLYDDLYKLNFKTVIEINNEKIKNLR